MSAMHSRQSLPRDRDDLPSGKFYQENWITAQIMSGIDQLLVAARAIRATLNRGPEETVLSAGDSSEAQAQQNVDAEDQVGSAYQARIEQLQRNRTRAARAHTTFLWYALASCLVFATLLAISFALHLFPFWWAGLPLIPMIFSLAKAQRCKAQSRDSTILLDLYQRRLSRVRHEWMGKGDNGADLELPGHLSSRDLDLFGEGSMFELLCDVDTPIGRETLARWLQIPASTEEVTARQRAVQSLRDHTELREKLALQREGDASEYSWGKLREWLSAVPAFVPQWAPWAGMLLSLALIAFCVCWGTGVLQMAVALWLLGAIIAAEITLVLSLRGRIRSILFNLHLSASKVASLRRLCALIQEQKFEAPRLLDLQRRLQGSSERVARLQRLIRLLDLRNNEWTVWPFMLALGTTQVAIQIERWRQRHGYELVQWLTVLGEFEALMAIACYAHENPDNPFPELANDGPLYDAVGLGHPLMDRRACVCNDLRLGADVRFFLLTGSNMSGKSTLLRAVGLSAALAWMGAPVRAKSLRLSRLHVCASIRIQDSLLDGASRFYAEVERLKAVLDIERQGRPVLFLIDELFGGTNSAERRVAAEAVIRSLVQHQGVGLVTTHDMALSEIGEMKDLKGVNVHFTDLPTADGQLRFDYRLHPGRLYRGNALKIIKLVGLEPE